MSNNRDERILLNDQQEPSPLEIYNLIAHLENAALRFKIFLFLVKDQQCDEFNAAIAAAQNKTNSLENQINAWLKALNNAKKFSQDSADFKERFLGVEPSTNITYMNLSDSMKQWVKDQVTAPLSNENISSPTENKSLQPEIEITPMKTVSLEVVSETTENKNDEEMRRRQQLEKIQLELKQQQLQLEKAREQLELKMKQQQLQLEKAQEQLELKLKQQRELEMEQQRELEMEQQRELEMEQQRELEMKQQLEADQRQFEFCDNIIKEIKDSFGKNPQQLEPIANAYKTASQKEIEIININKKEATTLPTMITRAKIWMNAFNIVTQNPSAELSHWKKQNQKLNDKINAKLPSPVTIEEFCRALQKQIEGTSFDVLLGTTIYFYDGYYPKNPHEDEANKSNPDRKGNSEDHKVPQGVKHILSAMQRVKNTLRNDENKLTAEALWEKALPEIKKIATIHSSYNPLKRFFVGQSSSTVKFYKELLIDIETFEMQSQKAQLSR